MGDDKILDQLREPEMTLLRELRFERASTGLRLSASMMAKISSLGVNTADLLLWNVDRHISSLTFPHLRYVSLTTGRGFEGPRVSDVIAFLRGHPTLQSLGLYYANYSDGDDAGTHIEPVALPHLKCARLGGRPSPPSPDSLPYIEVDLLPYLHLPSTGQWGISINPVNQMLPRDTNYLLTLIRAREIIAGPGGNLSGGSGRTAIELTIKESPSTLIDHLGLWIVGWGDLWVGPEDIVVDSQSWSIPDWGATTVDDGPEAGEADDDEFQAQLSRLGCYLDPLRWSPSPLATVETLFLCGFGYTRNKGKYLEYLRECFMGLKRVRDFQVKKTNPGMVVHLLQPLENESGGMVLVFPLLEVLSIDNSTPVDVPLPALLEVVKRRATLGNALKGMLVDDKKVDLRTVRRKGKNVVTRVLVR